MVSTPGDASGPWQRWTTTWLRHTRDRSLAYPVLLPLAAIDSAGYSVIAPTPPTLAERHDAGPPSSAHQPAPFPRPTVPPGSPSR